MGKVFERWKIGSGLVGEKGKGGGGGGGGWMGGKGRIRVEEDLRVGDLRLGQ